MKNSARFLVLAGLAAVATVANAAAIGASSITTTISFLDSSFSLIFWDLTPGTAHGTILTASGNTVGAGYASGFGGFVPNTDSASVFSTITAQTGPGVSEVSSSVLGSTLTITNRSTSTQDFHFSIDTQLNSSASIVNPLTDTAYGTSEFLMTDESSNTVADFTLSAFPNTAYTDSHTQNVTGTLTPRQSATFSFDTASYGYAVEAVPEPATLSVLAFGALAALKRRKK